MQRDRNTMEGKNIWTEFPSIINEPFYYYCKQAEQTNKFTNYTEYSKNYNKWFACEIYPSNDGYSIFFKDVSEKKIYENLLIDSNNRFNLIGKATNEALWENNLVTGELWANEKHQNLYGLTINDPIPDEEVWINRIHPEDREKIRLIHDNNFTSNKNIFNCEYRLLGNNNEYINIYDSVYFVRDENGKPIRIMGNMRDISQIKEIEKKLEESQLHLRTILDTEPQCIKLLNEKGEVLDMNVKGLEMIEADNLESVLNQPIVQILKEEYKSEFKKSIQAVFTGKTIKQQFEVIGLKGTHRWLETNAVPFLNKEGQITALLAVTTDISERKKVEQELEISFKSVQELTQHLQNIREEERFNISREIHDELGQHLVAMKMDIAWLDKKLNISDSQIKEKIVDIIELIHLMISSVRKISFNLRPYSLEDLGLNIAVEQYLKEFEERSNININFESNLVQDNLHIDLRTTLFRIVQESCTNIAKHSKANKVNIIINNNESEIILIIEDNGIGFNLHELPFKKTLGIVGMKERANNLGGAYKIVSELNRGTKVEVVIPKK